MLRDTKRRKKHTEGINNTFDTNAQRYGIFKFTFNGQIRLTLLCRYAILNVVLGHADLPLCREHHYPQGRMQLRLKYLIPADIGLRHCPERISFGDFFCLKIA